jgi:hypothetical protein
MNSIGKAIAIAFAGTALLSVTAAADPLKGYTGERSPDPEKETYAYLGWEPENVFLLSFVGPARYVGTVTGDPEKDTFAYQVVLVPRAPTPGSCR